MVRHNAIKKVKQEDKKSLSLDEFFRLKYLPFAQATKRRSQIDHYVYDKHIRVALGREIIENITSEDIDEWKLSQINAGYKPATVNKHSSILNRMFNLALHWGYVDRNPFIGAVIKKFPVGDYVQRFLTVQEISRLLAACKKSSHPYLYLFVSLLLLTGARKSEWRLAKWSDLDLEKRELFVAVSKSGQSRKILLSDEAIKVLQKVRQKSECLGCPTHSNFWIFPNPRTGKPYTSFHIAFFKAREISGLPNVRIHDLRHTYASLLINNGASIYEVQKLLGHSDISMTERYAHLFPNTLKDRVGIVAQTINWRDF